MHIQWERLKYQGARAADNVKKFFSTDTKEDEKNSGHGLDLFERLAENAMDYYDEIRSEIRDFSDQHFPDNAASDTDYSDTEYSSHDSSDYDSSDYGDGGGDFDD